MFDLVVYAPIIIVASGSIKLKDFTIHFIYSMYVYDEHHVYLNIFSTVTIQITLLSLVNVLPTLEFGQGF